MAKVSVRLTLQQIDLLLESLSTANPDAATAIALRDSPIVRLALELRRAKEPLEDDVVDSIVNAPTPGGG